MQSLAGSPAIDVSLARRQGLIKPVWFPFDKFFYRIRVHIYYSRIELCDQDQLPLPMMAMILYVRFYDSPWVSRLKAPK